MFQKSLNPDTEKSVRKALLNLLTKEGVDVRSTSTISKSVYYNVINKIVDSRGLKTIPHTEDLVVDPLSKGLPLDGYITCTCGVCYKPFALTPLEIMQSLYLYSTACPYCLKGANEILNMNSKSSLKTRIVQNATVYQGFNCDTNPEIGLELKKVGTNKYKLKQKSKEEIEKESEMFDQQKYATNNGRKLNVEVEIGTINEDGSFVKKQAKQKMSKEELIAYRKKVAKDMEAKKEALGVTSVTKEVEISSPTDIYKADEEYKVHSLLDHEVRDLNSQQTKIDPEEIARKAQEEEKKPVSNNTRNSVLDMFREDADELVAETLESINKRNSEEDSIMYTSQEEEYSTKVSRSDKFSRYLQENGLLQDQPAEPKVSNEQLLALTGQKSSQINVEEDFSDLQNKVQIGEQETVADEDHEFNN